jgi:hypothetical protein
MADKKGKNINDQMEELKAFYSRKKTEQKALKKLLEALKKHTENNPDFK